MMQANIPHEQSEQRPRTLIRERVDKTPDALLRTALTSIPRVNKTDVETLRASFGVRQNCPPSPYTLSSDRTCQPQSFAKIAQADSAQLARLPGFGPKNVARLKVAFERPFRMGTARSQQPPPCRVCLCVYLCDCPNICTRCYRAA